jgi:hypothetical protein
VVACVTLPITPWYDRFGLPDVRRDFPLFHGFLNSPDFNFSASNNSAVMRPKSSKAEFSGAFASTISMARIGQGSATA